MKHDIAKIKFMSDLGEMAMKLNASIDFEEADPFIEKIYTEFQSLSSAEKRHTKKWIKSRIKDSFRSLDKHPKWIESEPCWAYHDDEPMIFLSQTHLPQSDFTEKNLTYDEVVYLFGIRVPTDSGFEMKYTTITQQEGF